MSAPPNPQPPQDAAPAGRSPPRLLGATPGIRLWHWPGEAAATLVLFGPARTNPSGPMDWWGRGMAAGVGWNAVAFAAHEPGWYPAGEMRALLPAALAAMSGRRATFGVAMGGYGALKYARAVGADAALAVSPHYSLDPAEMPEDPLAARFFDPRRHAGMAVAPADLPDLPILVFDPLVRQDRAHAERLGRLPGVRAVRLARAGRGAAASLVEAGLLRPALAAAIEGDAMGAVTALRAARRAAPSLREATATALERRGRLGWARALREGGVRAAGAAPWRLQATEARAAGDVVREEAALRDWIAEAPVEAEPRLLLAERLRAQDRPDEAVAVVQAGLAAGLAAPALRVSLVEALLRARRFEEAVAAAQAVAVPADAGAQALLGRALLLAGRREEAAAAFERVLARAPARRDALIGLAVIEAAAAPGRADGPYLGRLVDSLAAAGAAEADWAFAIARLRDEGAFAAAATLAERALGAHPAATRLRLLRARAQHAAGASEAARAGLAEFLAEAPGWADGWIALADMLAALERSAEACATLGEAAGLHPGHAGLAARHALALLGAGEVQEAEAAARRAIGVDQAVAGAWVALVAALERQGRRRDAIAAARAATEHLPEGGGPLLFTLGRLLMESGDADGAADAYRRAAEGQHATGEAWIGLVRALRAAGRPEAAADVARRGLMACPDLRELAVILAEARLARGGEAAAWQALGEAMPADAPQHAATLAMAEALTRLGRRREALALLEEAAAAAPEASEPALRLGQALLEAEHFDGAADLFARIVEAAPGCAEAWVGLSDAERSRKRIRPALDAYRRAVAAGADRATIRQLRFRLFGEYDG